MKKLCGFTMLFIFMLVSVAQASGFLTGCFADKQRIEVSYLGKHYITEEINCDESFSSPLACSLTLIMFQEGDFDAFPVTIDCIDDLIIINDSLECFKPSNRTGIYCPLGPEAHDQLQFLVNGEMRLYPKTTTFLAPSLTTREPNF